MLKPMIFQYLNVQEVRDRMEYKVVDFPDITLLPKNKEQLIDSVQKKIERLKKSNSIEEQETGKELENALDWFIQCKVDLKELENEQYYRLGVHRMDEGKMVYNIQIWRSYLEDFDVMEKIFLSNFSEDLDNDEETLITD